MTTLHTGSIDGNEMVDDDGIGRMQERMKSLRNVGELHLEAIEDLRQISVAIDEFSFVGVLPRGGGKFQTLQRHYQEHRFVTQARSHRTTDLQLVVLDVVPQGGNDGGSGGRVNAQQAGQPAVEFELHRLVVQQQQQGALHVLVTRPFHLLDQDRRGKIK